MGKFLKFVLSGVFFVLMVAGCATGRISTPTPTPNPTVTPTTEPTLDPNVVSPILTYDWVDQHLINFNIHVVTRARNVVTGTCRMVIDFKDGSQQIGWENDCAITNNQPLQFKLEEWQATGRYGKFQKVTLEVRKEGGWEAAQKIDLTKWFRDVVEEFPTMPATPKLAAPAK
jgi:hypothetical protein